MKSAAQRFVEGLVALNGGEPGLLGGSGTTAVPDINRSGTRRVACYQVAGHTVLWCDPEILPVIESLNNDDTSLSDVDFRTWTAEVGGAILGQAVMKVAGDHGFHLAEPVGSVRRFDWSNPDDVEMMQAFVDTCDESDLDEAEVEMDDLDEMALALLDDEGAIVAYASARPFEDALPFGDIGILTAREQRRGGWGRAAVSTLIRDVLMPASVDPLYRCDPENHGSNRLSAALGFQIVAALTVAELPEA